MIAALMSATVACGWGPSVQPPGDDGYSRCMSDNGVVAPQSGDQQAWDSAQQACAHLTSTSPPR